MLVTLLTEAKFVAYGVSHWIALAILAVLAVAAARVGRCVRGGPRERLCNRGFAIVLLTTEIGFQVYSMLPGNWGLEHSLPFELCDLAWIAAAVALWTRKPWAAGMVYYWGLTLTLQALLTPKRLDPFPSAMFCMFFISHTLTVVAAVYLTWGIGLRPSWRSLGITVAATAGWGIAMLAFNSLAGTNYLFVNAKPQTSGSVFDVMPAWPWYLFVEFALGVAVWAMLTVPWRLAAPLATAIESD